MRYALPRWLIMPCLGAVGPSGANSDYLYNLCEALRALDIEDDDLYALEASVRAIRGD